MISFIQQEGINLIKTGSKYKITLISANTVKIIQI